MCRKEFFVKIPRNYKTANRNCAIVKEMEQKNAWVEWTAEDKTELGYINKTSFNLRTQKVTWEKHRWHLRHTG